MDHGNLVLNGFSEHAHAYAAKVLEDRGVQLRLGIGVKEVAPDHVLLSDGTTIETRCVVWAGGLMAAPIAANCGPAPGRGGRIDVRDDFSVDGFPGLYVAGDMANIPGPDGQPFPQLGSVALQSGTWIAQNILNEIAGKERKPFRYHDKGIMAMIGRGAAVAEVGTHRHELHGPVAFAAWLGVHAALMAGVRNRVEAFIDWGWDYFSKTGGPAGARPALERGSDRLGRARRLRCRGRARRERRVRPTAAGVRALGVSATPDRANRNRTYYE